MRNYFFDASAVVRLYAHERGSATVRDMFRSAVADPPSAQVMVCDLSLPETVSALLQIAGSSTGPGRGISHASLRRILPRVRSDFDLQAALAQVPATGSMDLAADLVERHRLRAADAVQLAAALRARDALARVEHATDLVFVSEDAAQCRAAEAEGLEVLRPAA